MKILTDGQTIDIEADAAVSLLHGGWSPGVATSLRSRLAGPPLDDVAETVRLTVGDKDGAGPHLNGLAQMLNGAAAFAEDERVPVVVEENGKQALITGVPTQVKLPRNYVPGDAEVSPVEMSFLRRGAWLEPGQEVTPVSTEAENPVVQSVTFSESADVRCPVDLDFRIGEDATYSNFDRGLLLVSNSTDDFVVIDKGTSGVSGGGPMGGHADRWEPSASGDTHFFIGNNFTYSTLPPLTDCVIVALYEASGEFAVRVHASNVWDPLRTVRSRWQPLVSGGKRAAVIGRVSLASGVQKFDVEAIAGVATQLDIDAFIIFRVHPQSYVVQLDKIHRATTADYDRHLFIEQRALSALRPAYGLRLIGSPSINYGSWRGNANLWLDGDTVAAMLLLTGDEWQENTDGGSTGNLFTLQAHRHRAHLIP